MTVDEFNALFDQKVAALKTELTGFLNSKLADVCTSLSESYSQSLGAAVSQMATVNENLITNAVGKQIVHDRDIPWKSVRAEMRKLLDCGAINGGTDESIDPDDIRLPLELVRVLVVSTKYSEMLITQLRGELGLPPTETSPEA